MMGVWGVFGLTLLLGYLTESLLGQEILLEPKGPGMLITAFPSGIPARIIMWGKQNTFEDQEVTLWEASPKSGCEEHGTMLTGNSSLFADGLNNCPLTNLIFNAQNRGAKALFIANHDDRKVSSLVIPNQLPGVQIHVFLIDRAIGQNLHYFLQSQLKDPIRLSLSFKKFAQQNSTINLQITYNPDNMFSAGLLTALYSSPFLSDMNAGRLQVDHKYVILHCTACEEKKYTFQQENCLSGGCFS